MKPKEIGREEYWAIRRALKAKAVALAKEHKGGLPASYWFSDSPHTCAYSWQDLPESFRKFRQCSYNSSLLHFIPHNCSCKERATMRSDTEAICLYRHKRKYWLTAHRIGRCPWKE